MLSLGDLIRASVTIYKLMDPKFITSSHIYLSSSRFLSLAVRYFQLDIWEAHKLNLLSNLSVFPQPTSFIPYYHHFRLGIIQDLSLPSNIQSVNKILTAKHLSHLSTSLSPFTASLVQTTIILPLGEFLCPFFKFYPFRIYA